MTVIKFFGGDFGNDTMLVRCNLSESPALVEINYDYGRRGRP